MQPCQGLRSSRKVPCQSSKVIEPAKTPLDTPTAQKQDNVSLRIISRAIAFCPARPPVQVPGRYIVLIDIGQCDRFSGDMVHFLGQRTHLGALLLIGCTHWTGQADARAYRRPRAPYCFFAFVPIIASAAFADRPAPWAENLWEVIATVQWRGQSPVRRCTSDVHPVCVVVTGRRSKSDIRDTKVDCSSVISVGYGLGTLIKKR